MQTDRNNERAGNGRLQWVFVRLVWAKWNSKIKPTTMPGRQHHGTFFKQI